MHWLRHADIQQTTCASHKLPPTPRLQAAQQQRVVTQMLDEREFLNDTQRTRLLEPLLSRYAQKTTEDEQLHNKR